MKMLMYLACPNRCSTNRFELWNASVFVDSQGRYLQFKAGDGALYRCTECGSPAIDLGEVPGAMAADREALDNPRAEYACPSCEELFSAPRDQSPVVCPSCGQTFPVGEQS
jgi:DNA-directed RNA polymerase subunit RPC12/RpoP